jgi:hypothetical protein
MTSPSDASSSGRREVITTSAYLATAPQPAYFTRVRDGKVEARLVHA